MTRFLRAATLVAAAVVASACSSAPAATLVPPATRASSPAATATPTPTTAPTNSPTPDPTAAPSATPVPTQAASPAGEEFPAGSVIATFEVGEETFRVLVTDPANVAIVNDLLAGNEAPRIPNGVVVRGDPSVNTGWSWHIDPATLEFADMTTGVCDGIPSYVEEDTITSDRFCPWGATVIAVEPANP